MKTSKLWSIGCLALALLLLLFAGGATALIDPYFHYHAPLERLEYPLNNQRYQNDGIAKNFSYDALITGTSMTENYKTSEFDRMFDAAAIKVSYSGGTIQELSATIRAGLQANPQLKLVLLGVDEWFLFSGKNMILADGEYPTYLYDDNLFNDIKYLLNKDVFCSGTVGVLEYTRAGNLTTSFDDYGSWANLPIGRAYAMGQYQRPEKVSEEKEFTQELQQRVRDTLDTSLLSLAREYPQVRFLFYFPPYSILNWDTHSREGTLRRQIEAFEFASSLLLTQENIHLFSFYTDFETITNLDNYRDSVHHSQQINTLLLERIAVGEYRLTEENYAQHWQQVRDFYTGYNYDALFSQ